MFLAHRPLVHKLYMVAPPQDVEFCLVFHAGPPDSMSPSPTDFPLREHTFKMLLFLNQHLGKCMNTLESVVFV